MPVQMIELEEVMMVKTTDESLESVVGGVFVVVSFSPGSCYTYADPTPNCT